MIPYLTVTESMNTIMIFKSSGTMQVPAFQSKERWNDGSYLKDESKETRLCVLSGRQWNSNITYLTGQYSHIQKKLPELHYFIIINKKIINYYIKCPAGCTLITSCSYVIYLQEYNRKEILLLNEKEYNYLKTLKLSEFSVTCSTRIQMLPSFSLLNAFD